METMPSRPVTIVAEARTIVRALLRSRATDMRDQPFKTDIDYHQVVLFEKAGEYGVVALTRNTAGFTVIGRSCRHTVDHSLQTEGFVEAKRKFENSVQQSVDDGWSVAWRGFPHGVVRSRCPQCHEPVPAEARYCGRCGGPVNR